MDSSSQVSSLYGPGAFAAWLCTTASVIISWTCNRHSRARDTIGNDLIATLTYPTVAAIHHLVELSKSRRENEEPAVETLDATFCVVLWYAMIGPVLMSLVWPRGALRRCICASVPSIICMAALASPSSPHDPRRKLPSGLMSTLVFDIASVTAVLPLIIVVLLWFASITKDASGRSTDSINPPRSDFESRRVTYLESGFKKRIVKAWVLSFATGLSTSVIIYVTSIRLPKDENSSPLTASAKEAVPQIGISVTELDQAVTSGAGALALAVSIAEALFSRRRSAWEKYQEWRSSCETLLEMGLYTEEEASTWRRYLHKMVQIEQELLDDRPKSELLLTMEQKKLEHWEERCRNERDRVDRMSREERNLYHLESAGLL